MGLRVTPAQVVELAIQMPATPNPITDLISHVRQSTGCSKNAAGIAVRTVLFQKLLIQVWAEEKIYSPTCAGSKGDPYWKMSVATWRKNDPPGCVETKE